MKKSHNKNRALQILRQLLLELPAITADIFYAQLRNRGFTEFEAVKVTGASIRTAAANGLIQKTGLCKSSKKNSSNLQHVWRSALFHGGDCRAALAFWTAKGFSVPIAEMRLMERLNFNPWTCA
jgi:hypothetical protein